jgi:prepilin-type N-terminal cleavage/methylation domain-containing protein
MKKRNKKGFTLVELIVVATIMVMIMGAILNWIRPINKFYDKTQALADSNDIGSILMDNVDDELRYATNIVVLQGYQGVPKFSGSRLVDSNGKVSSAFSAKLTDALIIDNDAVRGSQFKGYDANSNASHRKGAKGCIIKASIKDSVGIDVEHMECLGSESLYNDYGCHFEASLSILENMNKGKNLTIDMELTRPVRDGAGYKFDQFGFNQRRDFELVNINLTDAAVKNYQADFYSSLGVGKPLNYDTIAPASSNTGSLSGTYTYILYTKAPTEATKLNVTVLWDKNDPSNVARKWTVDSGKSLSKYASEIDSLIKQGEAREKTSGDDTNGYTKTTFDGILNDSGEYLQDYKTKCVTQDLTFYFSTTDATIDTPPFSFVFYDKFNRETGEKNPDGYYDDKSTYPFGFWDASTEGFDGTANFVVEPVGKKENGFVFKGWYKYDVDYIPTISDDDDTNYSLGWYVIGKQYTGAQQFYAIYEEKPTKKLNGPNGVELNIVEGDNNITNNSTYKKIVQEAINNPSEENKDKVFSHLEVINSDTGESKGVLDDNFDFNQINDGGTYSIKPVYNENTHPGAYEITLTFDDKLKFEDIQYNKLSFGSNGKTITVDVCKEDGVTSISSASDSWYHEVNNVYLPGDTAKIYIYNENPVTVIFKNARLTVDGTCRLKYDGTDDFVEVG